MKIFAINWWPNYWKPLLSGGILVFAFPPFELSFLAWIALIPFIKFCLTARGKTAFKGGLLFGLILHLYVNSYLAPVLYNHTPPWLAILTFILIIAILALFYGAFAYAANRACYYSALFPSIILVPFLWIAMEYLRSWGFLGYTVGFLGYTQWEHPFLLNLASAYGYWGLAYLMVMIQVILAGGWIYLYYQRYARREDILSGLPESAIHYKLPLKPRVFGKAGALFLVLLCFGLMVPPLLPKESPVEEQKIALIQPNNPQQDILSPDAADDILQRYLRLTQEAQENYPSLDLIVWPETAINYHIGEGDPFIDPVNQQVEEMETPLLYGAVYQDEGFRHNSIALQDPQQKENFLYHKKRLVPVVEYFPFHEWLNQLVDLDMALGRYLPGEEIHLLPFKNLELGGVICFESYFGDYTRRVAEKGAQHLFVLTNDGWFGDTIGLDQHAQAGSIRAAETGVGVTQVANTGITLSFDYQGNKTLKVPRLEKGYHIMETNFSSRPTIYRYAGEYFLYLAALAGLGVKWRNPRD